MQRDRHFLAIAHRDYAKPVHTHSGKCTTYPYRLYCNSPSRFSLTGRDRREKSPTNPNHLVGHEADSLSVYVLGLVISNARAYICMFVWNDKMSFWRSEKAG